MFIDLVNGKVIFKHQLYATRKAGIHLLTLVIAAIRMLVYGNDTDALVVNIFGDQQSSICARF